MDGLEKRNELPRSDFFDLQNRYALKIQKESRTSVSLIR